MKLTATTGFRSWLAGFPLVLSIVGILLLAGSFCRSVWAGQLQALSADTSPAKASSTLRETLWKASNEPWKKWVQNPLTVQASFYGTNILAATNSGVSITIDGISAITTGFNCTTETNTSLGLADLKPYKEYDCLIQSSNLTSLNLVLDLTQPNSLLSDAPGATTKPREYRVYINGALQDSLALANTATCAFFTTNCTIEIRNEPTPRLKGDYDGDNNEAAPGDGTWLSIGPGKSLLTNVCAIDWSVSIGKLLDSLGAGKLRIRESKLVSAYDPLSLYYSASSTNVRAQVDLVATNSNGAIRQLKAPQCFVDVVTQTNQEYQVRFYYLSQVGAGVNGAGLYTNLTGSPYVTWRILNPDTGASNRLFVIEQRNGLNLTNQLTYTSASQTNTWNLRYGLGSEERVESRGVTFSYSPTTNRTETVLVYYTGATTPAYKATETYRLYPWGWELKQTVTDPGSAALTTTFEYYESPSNIFTYRRPKSTIYPDGYWECRIYQDDLFDIYGAPLGALKYLLRPWEDSPSAPTLADTSNSLVTSYIYGSSGLGEDPYAISIIKDSYGVDPFDEPFGLNIHNVRTFYPAASVVTLYDFFFIPEGGSWPIGTGEVRYGDSQQLGFAGKPFWKDTFGGARTYFYYDSGAYNPTSRVFTDGVSSNAWRDTVVQGVSPRARDAWSVAGVTLEWDLGHDEEFLSANEQIIAMPRQSSKETHIFTNGYPMLKESYVFMGANSTNAGIFQLIEQWVYTVDSLGHVTNITRLDGVSPSVIRTIYASDWKGTNTLDGDLKLSETDENGIVTVFTYDSLKRVKSAVKKGVSASGSYPAQADISTAFSYDASSRVVSQITSSGSLAVTNRTAFDLSGRATSTTLSNVLTSTFAYASDVGITTTATLPDGSTIITSKYRDRRTNSVTGSAVVSEYHQYATATDSSIYGNGDHYDDVRQIEVVRQGSSSSVRFHVYGRDWAGRVIWDEIPGSTGANSVVTRTYYPDFLELDKPKFKNVHSLVTDAYGNTSEYSDSVIPPLPEIYDYDAFGRPSTQGVGTSQPILVAASLDRFTSQSMWFQTNSSGHWFEVVTNLTYLTDNSATPTITRVEWNRRNGFGANTFTREAITVDVDGNTNRVLTGVDFSAKTIKETNIIAQSSLAAISVSFNGLLQSESTPSVSNPTLHYYDGLAREIRMVDPLGNTSSRTYDPVTTWPTTTTAVNSGVIGYAYDSAGRVSVETAANGKFTRYAYNSRGQVTNVWGDVPYPQQLLYSAYGELTNLLTYQAGTAWNGTSWPSSPGTADGTIWSFHSSSGLLLSKTDAAGKSVSYQYDLLNRPLVRTWANSLGSTNAYDEWGQLNGVTYSDATPPVAYQDFSRAGLVRRVVDAGGTNIMAFDAANRMQSVATISGLLNGVTITNLNGGPFGRTNLQVWVGGSLVLSNSYGFDTYGRFGSVTNGTFKSTFAYVSQSDLPYTTIHSSSGTTVLTTTRSWEFGTRLINVQNSIGTTPTVSFAYKYDILDRRTRAVLADSSFWAYDYNDRNEVISGRRCWSDSTGVAGELYGYTFDNIGNRTQIAEGTGVPGGVRIEAYGRNNLNQITTRSNSTSVDVIGVAYATAGVTVNGNAATRQGEHFDYALSVGAPSGPAWVSVTNVATLGANSNTVTGSLLLPPGSQTFQYDLDGCLTNDLVWSYEWDAEKRLTRMTSLLAGSSPNSARKQLSFRYDNQGRRVSKVVGTWNGSAYGSLSTNKFVYDGWNLVAEVNGTNGLIRSYVWGPDLSGSITQAGGVGGLLSLTEQGVGTQFAGYDGNGNVTILVKTDQSETGRYEFGPFGEPIRITGTSANPFQFSTKYHDFETGLVYYGFRYYQPSIGRWLNRDPIGEEDANNLYLFVHNNSIFLFDPAGQFTFDEWLDIITDAGEGANDGLRGVANAFAGGLFVPECGLLYAADRDNSEFRTGAICGEIAVWSLSMAGGDAFLPGGDAAANKALLPGLTRLRRYFRLDRPHHGKGWHFDGSLTK